MSPTRPYFLRAVFEWILDNGCTPFLAVNAELPYVQVPQAFVEDGEITLNIAPSAVANFSMDNDSVSFQARFSGRSESIFIPMAAVLGLYASENGQGMAFPEDAAYLEPDADATATDDVAEARKGFTPVVVADTDDAQLPKDGDSEKKAKAKKKPGLSLVK